MDTIGPVVAGPVAKHLQCRDALARHVRTALAPGDIIPSERVLQDAFAVSRATIRRAVEALIADGLLTRVPAKGTYVSQPRLETQLHLASFSQDMRRRGREPSTSLLGIERSVPPPEATAALNLDPGDQAWRLTRIRYADGEPVALEDGWYPASVLPDLDRQDLSGSLYRLLANRYGLSIDSAEQTLWGEIAQGTTAHRLGSTEPVPLLVFRRLSRSSGRSVEFVVSRYRGDRYEVHMSLSADGPPAESGAMPERN